MPPHCLISDAGHDRAYLHIVTASRPPRHELHPGHHLGCDRRPHPQRGKLRHRRTHATCEFLQDQPDLIHRTVRLCLAHRHRDERAVPATRSVAALRRPANRRRSGGSSSNPPATSAAPQFTYLFYPVGSASAGHSQIPTLPNKAKQDLFFSIVLIPGRGARLSAHLPHLSGVTRPAAPAHRTGVRLPLQQWGGLRCSPIWVSWRWRNLLLIARRLWFWVGEGFVKWRGVCRLSKRRRAWGCRLWRLMSRGGRIRVVWTWSWCRRDGRVRKGRKVGCLVEGVISSRNGFNGAC